ncbi:MAG: transcription-repair coupling factor, partial [Coriobacteriia bacterium]|nr:transcription-repair coupling factor [Coriobacteriia bacterium]
NKQLKKSKDYLQLLNLLRKTQDVRVSLAHSARPLIVAAQFIENPRPSIVVVSGEEQAHRFAQTLSTYLGQDKVLRFYEREDYPWDASKFNARLVGNRSEALYKISQGEAKIMVCSTRALIQKVAPPHSNYVSPLVLKVYESYEIHEIISRLNELGYSSADGLSTQGSYSHRGDTLDIWPAQSQNPVRLEFFGDYLERMRNMIAATSQTINDIDEVRAFAVSELPKDQKAVSLAQKLLYKQASQDDALAHDLERLREGIAFEGQDIYLPYLYPDALGPLAYIPQDALVILAEPRALFDDAMRAFEDVQARAKAHKIDVDGLYINPKNLDFGTQQRLTLLSILRSGSQIDVTIEVKRPEVSGRDDRLLTRLKSFVDFDYASVLTIPDRQAREHMRFSLSNFSIPFEEVLEGEDNKRALPEARVTLNDSAVPVGVVIPSAKLALISIEDVTHRSAKRAARSNIDITDITFPFKPGDYVVHSNHGIAHFNEIVRQEVGGFERDYFLLEYAHGDKLYVPLEQVDKLTRYIGPDSDQPRLTRLNTSDWSRVSVKARKSAKKLAFDLVDLYARRSTVKGFSYSADNAWQREMEEAFPYEPTPDQIRAIADIKADMESDKPMDRLLGGDVGFGKTEVAMRAAFKAVQDEKQVMVLCPTTILAQQHYQTFFERFAPFNIEVEVLSRFRTPKQQKDALEGFATGSVSVLIGTHRLLSNDVNPHNLGLVIIDEEQRFGVGHKEQLKTLREQLDVLTLSATPIPRTMQMAMSGVREMSLIKTPPKHRRPVKVHVGEWDEDIVSGAIRREVERGGQAYYVSNRVKTIDDASMRIHSAAPEARVGIAHGQMSERELESVMENFAAGEIDVLLATTIIESGIDNPKTNTLIIEDSQRLGLAQLYQLKGRVGRGFEQAYAYFMFPPGESLTQQAVDRLTAIEEFQDLGSGMDIAMRDLEIRGAGSLMGAEQSGNLSSVGFDLFTQMLGEAIAEARGEGDTQVREVALNLSVDYYFSEEYIPDADKRVRAYRRLASAQTLDKLDEIEDDLINDFGPLEEAGQNLIDRERIKIRALRLGVSSLAYIEGKLVIQGLEIKDAELLKNLKSKHALYYPKSKKLKAPIKKDKSLIEQTLSYLSTMGGSDEEADSLSEENY